MVACFGEILLRLSPSLQGQWIHDASMPTYIGGAELNVATALSKWGIPTRYITAMPDNYLSAEIVEDIRKKDIDPSCIHFSGNRIGLYYLPQGKDMKNAGVIYDRAGSAFAEMKPGMIDWEKALQGCKWFHFSAISPALNSAAASICMEAVQIAAKNKLKISVDLNYRSKLWQYEASPVKVMSPLLKYCNVVMGNIWAAEKLLGITAPIQESVGKSRNELVEAAGKSMRALHDAYSNVETMAYTFRMDENYFGVIQHGPDRAISRQHRLEKIVDRVGSGDCFMGGLIYGLYKDHSPQEIINFASAAAVGKLQEKGDHTNQSVESIQQLLNTAWTEMKQ